MKITDTMRNTNRNIWSRRLAFQAIYSWSINPCDIKELEAIFESDENGKVQRKCKLCSTGELSLKNSFRGGAFMGFCRVLLFGSSIFYGLFCFALGNDCLYFL